MPQAAETVTPITGGMDADAGRHHVLLPDALFPFTDMSSVRREPVSPSQTQLRRRAWEGRTGGSCRFQEWESRRHGNVCLHSR